MPAASELQAHLAWRLLVTETAPPPVQVGDDRNVSTPVTNRRHSSPAARAPPCHDQQRGSPTEESKVQLTDVYSARCHWRPKHCGECDKLRLLNSRLVGRLQAAEAHIKILTRDHSETLEELSSRIMSEGEKDKLLVTKLSDLQPYLDLLEGITAEVNRRLAVSVGTIGTTTCITEISTPAASIAWIGNDAKSIPVKVCMDTTMSPSSPASPTVELTPALAASGRSSPEDSALEGCYAQQLDRSQRSLEGALLKSLEVTAETGKAASPERARPSTPDWPRQRQSQANVASSADARKPCQRTGNSCGLGSCQRPGSSCGPRHKVLPGKARVEPGSHGRPPVPLPHRGSSRPRQNTERHMSSC